MSLRTQSGEDRHRMIPPIKSVLLIDDNEDLLTLVQLSLQTLGFKVITAASGAKGLEIFASHHVDLVIVDYKMPDIDGGKVTQEIRRLKPLTPILMYSAALEEVPSKVLELVDEFVSKQEPFSNLLDHIPRVVARPDRRRRAFPRYPIQAVFVAIEEEPTGAAVFYGESSDLSEGGLGGVLDQEEGIAPQKKVRLHVTLPSESFTTRASVRHRTGLRHGFQFLDLTAAQLEKIRNSISFIRNR